MEIDLYIEYEKSAAYALDLLKENKRFCEISRIGNTDSNESCDILCEITTSLGSKLITLSQSNGNNTIREKLLQLIKYISLVVATKPNKKVLIIFVTNGIYKEAKTEIDNLLSIKTFTEQILKTNIVISFQFFISPDFGIHYVASKLTTGMKELKKNSEIIISKLDQLLKHQKPRLRLSNRNFKNN
jgi:hypothetical protein